VPQTGMAHVLLGAMLSLSVPAAAQWQRVVWSGKGEFTDVPKPHPLSYFTANPYLRDDGGDLGGSCAPPECSIRTVSKPVGLLAGYHIVDLLYYVSTRALPDDDQVKWKFILVQVGPDLYKEIFQLQALYTTVSIAPSRIVDAGNERVLVSMDSDGGNGGGCWEGYWWFDASGPHALDFSRLTAAMKAAVPEETQFRASCGNLNLGSQQIQSWVQKSKPECQACDFVGDLTARFRIEGAVVEPLAVTFKPGNPQLWDGND